jgi:pyruvate carboxylase
VSEGKREAKAAFGKDEMYLEKLVERARHVEVQLLGDDHGNLVHLFERDCSVQRRNQKVVERAPAPYLDAEARRDLTGAAVKPRRGRQLSRRRHRRVPDGCRHRRILLHRGQSAHPGRAHRHRGGDRHRHRQGADPHRRRGDHRHAGIGRAATGRDPLNGHALQCRITTEDPEANFMPDYGRITAYRGATGFGVRLDGGTAYAGAVITRFYDPLLEKVTCWAPTAEEAIARMHRALREFRIRGVATNLAFLENIITHPDFVENRYTTRFIDETPALFDIEGGATGRRSC